MVTIHRIGIPRLRGQPFPPGSLMFLFDELKHQHQTNHGGCPSWQRLQQPVKSSEQARRSQHLMQQGKTGEHRQQAPQMFAALPQSLVGQSDCTPHTRQKFSGRDKQEQESQGKEQPAGTPKQAAASIRCIGRGQNQADQRQDTQRKQGKLLQYQNQADPGEAATTPDATSGAEKASSRHRPRCRNSIQASS